MKRLSRPWPAYLIGQSAIVIGAGLMELTGSYVPMALAGSAAILLTLPLLRHVRQRSRKQLRR